MVLVKGIVENGEGGLVHGALVAVEEGTSPFPDLALSTNAEGQFTIDLPVGRFRLTAHSQDGGYGTVDYDSLTSNSLVIRLSPLQPIFR